MRTRVYLRRLVIMEKVKDRHIEQYRRLVASVAHDLRQPIMYLQWAVENGFHDESRKDKIQNALHYSEELAELLIDLWKLSENPACRTPLTPLIQQCIDLRKDTKDITYGVETAPSVPPAFIDVLSGRRIFSNILTNAVEASPKGSRIKIAIDHYKGKPMTECTLDDFVRTTIVDEGPGISTQQIRRLGQPGMTSKQAGHGLGLYIAYTLADQMNGTVQWTRLAPKGTRTEIYLPAAKKPHVLLVEDEELVGELLSEQLKSGGYDVLWMSTGKEALDAFSQHQFDAILLDATLPDMSGYDVQSQFHALNPNVPSILCTGHVIDVEKVKAYHFAGSISKPFNKERILKTLDDVLS